MTPHQLFAPVVVSVQVVPQWSSTDFFTAFKGHKALRCSAVTILVHEYLRRGALNWKQLQ